MITYVCMQGFVQDFCLGGKAKGRTEGSRLSDIIVVILFVVNIENVTKGTVLS